MVVTMGLPRPDTLLPKLEFTVYEKVIPEFAAKALEVLYENLHSCIPYLRMYSSFNNVNTYVARKGVEIVTILLFQFDRGKIEVLNQFIRLDDTEIALFANHIFSHFLSADVIVFSRIETTIKRISYPLRSLPLTEDFAIALPKTIDQYDASLGKSTRRHVKSCGNKLQKKYREVSFEFLINDADNERLIRHIANLHRERLATRHVKFDESVTDRRIVLSKQFDTMIGIVRIDGEICAGSITYRVGRQYFASMLAHDPAYNKDSIGFLCAYHTVRESISRCGTVYHFGQSRFRYKDNLLAARREINHVEIFRSNAHQLMNIARVLRLEFRSRIRQVELWSADPAHKQSAISRFVASMVTGMRSASNSAMKILELFGRNRDSEKSKHDGV